MNQLVRLRTALAGREGGVAAVIAALVVAAAWVVILQVGDAVRSQDEPAFFALAQNMASEGAYINMHGELSAYTAPGLVFFLTPLVWLGAGLMELRLANAALVGIGLMLMFDLGRRHGGPLAGLFAVVMIPAWPVILYASTTLYPQTLAAFLLVLTVWLLDRLSASGQTGTAMLAGLACGWLVLTTPIVLLVFPAFMVWILLRSSRRWLHLVVFCAISGSFVSAWTVRNYIAFDTFIPVATSSGFNLLAGNAPKARYNSSLDIMFPDYVYTEITGKNEIERNEIFTEAAIQAVRENPGRALTLYLGKFLHWFHFSNELLSDEMIEGGASGINVNTRELILGLTYGLVILLPLVARLAMLRRYPFRPVEVLFLCLWIGAGLAYAVFFTRVRFRIPYDWLIITSNAMFLASLAENWLDRRAGRVAS